jgi:hypothetical protein
MKRAGNTNTTAPAAERHRNKFLAKALRKLRGNYQRVSTLWHIVR